MSQAMKRALIVTLSANQTLGESGETTMKWACDDDKKWFQEVTESIGTVVMGRKTFDVSFKKRRALPRRMNYVLTRDPASIPPVEGSMRAVTLSEWQDLRLANYCVIGGAEIYRLLWKNCDVIYLSRHKHAQAGGELFVPDLSHAVLFQSRELAENIEEIYTQPTFLHPEISLEYDDNEFMEAAEKSAREYSLDQNHPTGAVLVKDGKIIGHSANGSHWHQQHAQDPELRDFAGCMRKKLNCPSGTGYDLCEGCSNANHSEPRVVKNARDNGCDPAGATCYLWGHWWYCEPCSRALYDAGVRKVVASRKWTKDFLGIYTD